MNRPKINTPADGKCGYIAFFDGRSAEVWADTSLQAKERAVAYFKPAKSKKHMVHVAIAEVEGTPVVHSTAEFG
jgi:hypothetical protein